MTDVIDLRRADWSVTMTQGDTRAVRFAAAAGSDPLTSVAVWLGPWVDVDVQGDATEVAGVPDGDGFAVALTGPAVTAPVPMRLVLNGAPAGVGVLRGSVLGAVDPSEDGVTVTDGSITVEVTVIGSTGGGGGGGGVWGSITGTLSAQADLTAALAGKADDADVTAVQADVDAHEALTTTAHGGVVPGHLVDLFSADVDMSGGSWTDLPLLDGSTVPRGFLAGAAVCVVEGGDLGLWTVTASGPCTAGPALSPGDVLSTSGLGLVGVAQSSDGVTVAEVMVAATRAELDAAIGALPHNRFVTFVYACHDGSLVMDGVADLLTHDGIEFVSDGSQYDGFPVMRLTSATIDGLTTVGVESVIALTGQTNPTHNGIWELFHDSHGVVGDYCVRTVSWNGVYSSDPADDNYLAANTPFLVVGGTLFGLTWRVTTANGMDSPSIPLLAVPTPHAASHGDGGTDEVSLNASQITAGTVATARLGSGTANATTFLRGDQTWAVPAGGGGGVTAPAIMPAARAAGTLVGTDLVPMALSLRAGTQALAPGEMVFCYVPADAVGAGTIDVLGIHVSATSLTAGQQVFVARFDPAADGYPGAVDWSQAITVGTSATTFEPSGLAISHPAGPSWMAILNPSGNAGSVTFRAGVPDGPQPAGVLGISTGAIAAVSSVASVPADMSTVTFRNGPSLGATTASLTTHSRFPWLIARAS